MTQYGDKRLPSRFWKRVEPTSTGCWLWTGSHSANGRGMFFVAATSRSAAHLIAFDTLSELERAGYPLRPMCVEVACVRPEHWCRVVDPAEIGVRWRATREPGYYVDASGALLGPGGPCALKTTRGYLCVSTRHNACTLYVHQLVCEAFHGPRPTPAHQVAHWNGVRTDNRPENLRWALPIENSADMVRHGTQRTLSMPGMRNGNAKLTDRDVLLIRELHRGGRSKRALAREFNVSNTLIYSIITRRAWAHLPPQQGDPAWAPDGAEVGA